MELRKDSYFSATVRVEGAISSVRTLQEAWVENTRKGGPQWGCLLKEADR